MKGWIYKHVHLSPPPPSRGLSQHSALLEKFWRISLYLTDDADAKLSVT